MLDYRFAQAKITDTDTAGRHRQLPVKRHPSQRCYVLRRLPPAWYALDYADSPVYRVKDLAILIPVADEHIRVVPLRQNAIDYGARINDASPCVDMERSTITQGLIGSSRHTVGGFCRRNVWYASHPRLRFESAIRPDCRRARPRTRSATVERYDRAPLTWRHGASYHTLPVLDRKKHVPTVAGRQDIKPIRPERAALVRVALSLQELAFQSRAQ